jgi:hypothetical protein
MQTSLEPVGPKYRWLRGSAVTEVTSTLSGLRVVLAGPADIDRYVEFHFANPRAFQVMDEGDMLAYWQASGQLDHALYRVAAGGWCERMADHYLNVTASLTNVHEWLIVSSDLCVSVIAAEPPHMREFG